MIYEGRKERIGLPKGEARRDVSQKKVDRSTLQLRDPLEQKHREVCVVIRARNCPKN
jgi:hypothetical protein